MSEFKDGDRVDVIEEKNGLKVGDVCEIMEELISNIEGKELYRVKRLSDRKITKIFGTRLKMSKPIVFEDIASKIGKGKFSIG